MERLFFAEIARLRDEPVGPAELAKAKKQLEVSLVRSLATNHPPDRFRPTYTCKAENPSTRGPEESRASTQLSGLSSG